MTICTVLRRFPISYDGMTSIGCKPDDVIDVPEVMLAGLVKEKYVKTGGVGAAKLPPENKNLGDAPENKGDPGAGDIEAAAVEIPAGWDSAGWRVQRKIAADIAGHPVKNKADATAVIAAEIARRSA